jgi:hypothetical protein
MRRPTHGARPTVLKREVRPRALWRGKAGMFGPSTAAQLQVQSCSRCGHRTVCWDGLCLACGEIHRWSSANRAFCALIHRDSPIRLQRAKEGQAA